MHGFAYANGQANDIGSLGGGYTVPTAISATGSVTGVSAGADGSQHAFLFSGGALQDVGTLGGTFSVGYALNAGNQIAGQSTTSTGQLHAFATEAGTLIDLGAIVETLAPGVVTESVSLAINDQGQVIGHYTVNTPSDPQMPTQTRSFIAKLNPSVGNGGGVEGGVVSLLQDLVKLSTGVGPGKSLANKAREISNAYSAGNTARSCSGLNAYRHEVAAHHGKKVPHGTALLLNAEVATIQGAMGCGGA
jgi:probable HAF family extracellular repeat protein